MVLAVVCLALAIVAGCSDSTASLRPSPSLVELDFTPQPTATVAPRPSSSPSPSIEATWPDGWDAAFCAMLGEAVISQELVVDIERAIDEDANRDARGLARELTATSIGAIALVDAVPDWEDGDSALVAIGTLMDLGAQIGPEYETHFRDDSRAALRRARNLRRDNEQAVPTANAALDELAQAGLSCPGLTLQLESP